MSNIKIGIASADFGFHEFEDPETGGKGFTFPGGSAFYRLLQPLRFSGVDYVSGLLGFDGSVLTVHDYEFGNKHDDCDVIIMQRCIWDGLPEAIDKAKANGQTIINDMDDWFDGLPPSNVAFNAMYSIREAFPIFRAVLRRSDAIINSTPFLVEAHRKYAPSFLWRNSIDFDSFPEKHEHVDNPPSIGWFGTLRFRDLDTEQLAGIVGPYVNRLGTKFIHVGHEDTDEKFGNPLHERLRVDPALIEQRPPIPFVFSSWQLYDQYDIGLVPLAPTRFNDAKSFLKGVEHVASGIPYIASPSEEYRWLHERGIGRIVRKARDWTKHLDELRDPEVRSAEAATSLERLKPLVDINVTVRSWLEIIESVMPS
jgi:hypothetical protein